jgi:hypothetical protein
VTDLLRMAMDATGPARPAELGAAAAANCLGRERKGAGAKEFLSVLRSGGSGPRTNGAGVNPGLGRGQENSFGPGSGADPAPGSRSGPLAADRACRRDEDERGERSSNPEKHDAAGCRDFFDPLVRSLAAQDVRGVNPPADGSSLAQLAPELEFLMTQLVRRAAWGGDRRRGTARIELGSGELAGATLLVESEQNEVRIELELPAGVLAEPWRERIAARLSARGLAVRELSVR